MADPVTIAGKSGAAAGFVAGAAGSPVVPLLALPDYVDQFVAKTATFAEFHYRMGASLFGSLSDWLGDVVRASPLSARSHQATCYSSGEPISCPFNPLSQRPDTRWIDPSR